MNDFEVTTNNQEIVSIKVTNDLPGSIPNRSYVPTCTELERKFLDRIKQGTLYTSTYSNTKGVIETFIVFDDLEKECSIIIDKDFPGIDLKELMG